MAFLRGNFNDDDRLLFARSLELFSDEPRQRSEDAAYTNPLVEDLTIAGSARLRSQVGDLLTREQLQPLVREQLETELNGKIRVASIFKVMFICRASTFLLLKCPFSTKSKELVDANHTNERDKWTCRSDLRKKYQTDSTYFILIKIKTDSMYLI